MCGRPPAVVAGSWMAESAPASRPVGFVRPNDEAAELGRPRWDGRARRVEAWRVVVTDRTRGDAVWVHAETHAPDRDVPVAQGWCAYFPRDREPVWQRFGPLQIAAAPAEPERAWFDAAGVHVAQDRSWGETGSLRWDLTWHDGSVPMSTVPGAVWRAGLASGAVVVPQPAARVSGQVEVAGQRLLLHDAVGAVTHAYGRARPRQWAWLHADLGHGAVAELASVVAGAGPIRSPPISLAQLRAGGRDWPRDPLLAAAALRGHLGLPAWSVSGRWGRRRLRAWVHLPASRCVTLGCEDPDGSAATRTATGRADADVLVERRCGGRWRSEAVWQLRGTAHAEVGFDPTL